ncbi:MAG: type II secretion system protein [Candidatus Moranbacteria bacterium]|nr:type II secretion system protein [Candidatus Moranbacteria bacterium]
MKKFKSKNKGFTLLELVFSVTLFIIIIGGVVLFGIRSIQAHQRSQAMQEALENARFAVESLNKTIRTSHEIKADDESFDQSQTIFVEDNAQEKSYCYQFDNNKLQRKEAQRGAVNDCSGTFDSGFYDLVGSDEVAVNGGFYVKETVNSGSDKERGFVRTVVNLEYTGGGSNSPFEKSSVLFQSSVSLRDYGYDL